MDIINTVKLEIYESFYNGVISDEEVDFLLESVTSKNDRKRQCNFILKYWAKPSGKQPLSKQEALKIINEFETKNKIDPDSNIGYKVFEAFAITNYLQSKFNKYVNNFDDKYISIFLSNVQNEYIEIKELSEKLNSLLSSANSEDKKDQIVTDFLIENSKKYGTIEYRERNNKVYKVESLNVVVDNALKFWNDKKMKIVSGDGGGNYLLYSPITGKFYDYDHESDSGENYKKWLTNGVSYKDFMNHIRNYN